MSGWKGSWLEVIQVKRRRESSWEILRIGEHSAAHDTFGELDLEMDLDYRRESHLSCTRHAIGHLFRRREELGPYDVHVRRTDICPFEGICGAGNHVDVIYGAACGTSEIRMRHPDVDDAVRRILHVVFIQIIAANQAGHLDLSQASRTGCRIAGLYRGRCERILDQDMAEIGPLVGTIRELFDQIEIAGSRIVERIAGREDRRELDRCWEPGQRIIIKSQFSVLPVGELLIWKGLERLVERFCVWGQRSGIISQTSIFISCRINSTEIERWSASRIAIPIMGIGRIPPDAVCSKAFLIAEHASVEVFLVVDRAAAFDERGELFIEIKEVSLDVYGASEAYLALHDALETRIGRGQYHAGQNDRHENLYQRKAGLCSMWAFSRRHECYFLG